MTHKNWKPIIRCSAAVVAALLSAGAYAQQRSFDLPEQEATKSLPEFARQAGIQIAAPTEQLKGMRTPRIKGEFDIREALEQLLRGTGLTVASDENGMIVLQKAIPAQAGAATAALYERGEGAQLRLAQAVGEQDEFNKSLAAAAGEAGESSSKVADESQASGISEVIVTGSRITRAGFETTMPTTVISNDQIMQAGLLDIGQILMRSPQISTGLGPASDTFSRDLGSSFINLRGLGQNRTLVLIDGRRRVSGSREGSQVDLSTIPPGMIESVEIITGGASAVYGADAVSGVVNVKLKKIEGFEATVRGGISQEGDAENYAAYVNGGGSFADGKGHASFGMSAQKAARLRYIDRDYAFGEGSVDFVSNPTNTGPNDGIPDRLIIPYSRLVNNTYEPTFVVGGQRYIYDGGLVAFDSSHCYDGGLTCSGGPYGYHNKEPNLLNPRKVFSAISDISYELRPGLRFVAGLEFSHGEAETSGQSFFDGVAALSLSRNNPTIPQEVIALMDANGLTTLPVSTAQEERLGTRQYDNSRSTFTVDVGFEGELANRFDWQVFYQYGHRLQSFEVSNTRIQSRFRDAVDAIADPDTGEPICASAAARAAGCIPINLFSGVPMTREEKAYYNYAWQRKVENEQAVAGFQITGPLFDLPAGPLSVAFGGEYRKDTLSAADDGLAARGELYPGDNGAGPIEASMDVIEAFVEAVMPVLKDKPFAKSLEVEGAMRFSDYSSIGSTLAWKLGGSWSPVEDIRFRVTRSTSVRAPNINELYGPQSHGILNLVADPCNQDQIGFTPNREANCRALGIPAGWVAPPSPAILTVIGGNPNLTEETSNSWSIGVVATPRFAPRLRLSADWWAIEIEDAVQSLSGLKIVDNCVDSPGLNNVFCPLITRGNAAGINDPYVVSQINLRQVNVGLLSAKGIDISAAYGFELGELSQALAGGLDLRLSIVHLAELEELVNVNDPSTLMISDGEPTNPAWRGLFSMSYRLRDLTAVWSMRYVGSAELDVQRTREFNIQGVPSRLYHDLFIGYQLPAQTHVQFGVNNLLDKHPPRLPRLHTGTFGNSHYENIGRNFFLGVTKTF